MAVPAEQALFVAGFSSDLLQLTPWSRLKECGEIYGSAFSKLMLAANVQVVQKSPSRTGSGFYPF